MSTIAVLGANETGSNSRLDINSNFANLNTDKLEKSAGQYKTYVTVAATTGDYPVSSYADVGAAINAAYAGLPSGGGCIWVVEGTYSFSTPIVFGTNGKIAALRSSNAGSCFLKYTPTSGNAITLNSGDPTGHLVYELTGFTLMGKSSLVAGGQANTNTSVGVYFGGNQGCAGGNLHDCNINGFGSNIEIGQNAYMLNIQNCGISGGNGGQASRGSLVHINTASNSGERNVFIGCNFTDPGNSDATNGIYVANGGTASNFFSSCSIDNAQFYVGASNSTTTLIGCHIENPGAPSSYPEYIPVLGVASDQSTQLTIIACEFANSASNRTWTTVIRHGGQLTAIGNHIDNYNGSTITNFVLHDLDNGIATDYIAQTQIQGGALTNLIGGSGGMTYSRATGNAVSHNVDNSYTIGMRAMASNTNEFFSGNATVATFNHAGDWTFSGKGSFLGTLESKLYADGALGPELRLNNPADTADGDQFAVSVYDGGSGSPFRGGLLWTAGATGQPTLAIKGGAGQVALSSVATLLTLDPAGKTTLTGQLSVAASSTARSALTLPTGSAPTSPVDGDMWREDNTNTGLKIRVNGVTKTVTLA